LYYLIVGHEFLKLLFVGVVLFSSLASGVFLRASQSPKTYPVIVIDNIQKEIVSKSIQVAGDSEIRNNNPAPYYPPIIPFADFNLKSVLDDKQELIARSENFIEVDLNTMQLSIYKEGQRYKNFSVLSKGREGSWWETPTGKYTAIVKEPNHFSSIGKVYMPYSVQFYGNFYIHGWPYYPDGSPVPTTYSGGCIRISTEDAKEVFDFIKPSMPIIIFDGEADTLSFSYQYANSQNPPIVSADAFLIADLNSRKLVAFKNQESALPIASLAKLMTAVVASELINLDNSITATEEMLTSNGETPGLTAGKRFKAFDLLYPLLEVSSNDAAEVISYFIGKNQFIKAMNDKAASLGMAGSYFADTSGISGENTSTLTDLLKLLEYIANKRKFILDISKGKDHFAFGPSAFSQLPNYNHFADNDEFLGGKVGYSTAAGETMASVWKINDSNNTDRKIVIIVLGSQDRQNDTLELLNWVRYNI